MLITFRVSWSVDSMVSGATGSTASGDIARGREGGGCWSVKAVKGYMPNLKEEKMISKQSFCHIMSDKCWGHHLYTPPVTHSVLSFTQFWILLCNLFPLKTLDKDGSSNRNKASCHLDDVIQYYSSDVQLYDVLLSIHLVWVENLFYGTVTVPFIHKFGKGDEPDF